MRKVARPPSLMTELIVLLIGSAVVFGAMAWWIATVHLPAPAGQQSAGLTAFVATIGAWAATAGWLIQRHTNRVLARKQHTMNVLLSMRNSELYNNNRINIRTRYPIGQPLTPDQVREFNEEYAGTSGFGLKDGRGSYPPGDSIIFFLNYLEAIAVSVLDGDLDEAMVKSPLEPTFKSAVRRFWPLLRDDLKVKTFGDPLRSPDEIYAKLYLLVLRWGLTESDVEDFNKGTKDLK